MSKNKAKSVKNTTILRGLDPERAGIDIGASSVFVCVADANGHQQVKEYSTFTQDLKAMVSWLKKIWG